MPTQGSEKWPLSASPNFPWKRSYPRVSWQLSANNWPRTMPTPELSLTWRGLPSVRFGIGAGYHNPCQHLTRFLHLVNQQNYDGRYRYGIQKARTAC